MTDDSEFINERGNWDLDKMIAEVRRLRKELVKAAQAGNSDIATALETAVTMKRERDATKAALAEMRAIADKAIALGREQEAALASAVELLRAGISYSYDDCNCKGECGNKAHEFVAQHGGK